MGKHSDTLKALFDQWQGGKKDNLEEYLAILADDIEYDHFLHPTLAQVSPSNRNWAICRRVPAKGVLKPHALP